MRINSLFLFTAEILLLNITWLRASFMDLARASLISLAKYSCSISSLLVPVRESRISGNGESR